MGGLVQLAGSKEPSLDAPTGHQGLIEARPMRSFDGSASHIRLDDITPRVTITHARKVQILTDTRLAVKRGTKFLVDVPPNVPTEIVVRDGKASLELIPYLVVLDETAPEVGFDRAISVNYPASIILPVGPYAASTDLAWINPGEAAFLEYGVTCYRMSARAGTGSFKVQGRMPDRPDLAIDLTAAVDIPTATMNELLLMTYLSDAAKKWPGERRISISLGGASSVTFMAFYHGWSRFPAGGASGAKPAVADLVIYTDGFIQP